MCGIAGVIGCPTSHGAMAGFGRALWGSLRHRGPDDHGWLTFSSQGVQRGRGTIPDSQADAVFFHWRLSILDLSDAGWQPMRSPDGRYHLIFNGEIYNYLELRTELETLGHAFRSHSDTEVLLHAYMEWGHRSLSRLVGMFAFGILDTQARRLFLARDFLGIKPLYLTSVGNTLAFASEIKALLELPGVQRRVHPQRLYEYLRFGRTDHGQGTLFSAIQQLPAAHYLETPLDQPTAGRPVSYWRLDTNDTLDISFQEASRQVRDLFLQNVGLHLRSDVPVGAALSGGIDSSAIVAAMRCLEPRLDIHTFSYVADDPAINEERWVGIAGTSAGAHIHKVSPRPEELVEDLDGLIYLQDEPFGSTSIYAQHRVFRLAREAGVTVMLDGQGADELLGGYRPYLAARFTSLIRKQRWLEAARFLRRAARQPGSGGLFRLLLQSGSHLCPAACKKLAKELAGESSMPQWLNSAWFKKQQVRPLFPDQANGKDVLRGQLQQTLVETSLPMLLRYEDRNSMAFSIESRVPFLTVPLVEFILRLPEEYLIGPDGGSKSVFRQAMRGIVPDAILDRRDKIGFATPERAWLGTLRPWVEKTLASDAARNIPALNHERMTREWQAVLQGRRRFDFRLWRWINLIRWADRFDAVFPN